MKSPKTLFDHVSEDTIDLNVGAPSQDVMPLSMLREAASKAFEASNWSILQYGPERGDGAFLNALAAFLSRQYGEEVKSQHLCVTSGASQSLANLVTLFTTSSNLTSRVFLQHPTYHLVFQTLLDAGYTRDQFVAVPEDRDGIKVDWLESQLAELEHEPAEAMPDGRFRHLLYCVPTFANPSTTTLSSERRRELVRIARKYDILVVCDDVYDCLNYEPGIPIPRRVVAYDLEDNGSMEEIEVGPGHKGGNVVSNGTFSKMLGPGVRCGWVEGRSELIRRIEQSGIYFSGGSPAHLSSLILLPLLLTPTTTPITSAPLDAHLASLRATLRHRLHCGLLAPIRSHLVPLGCAVWPSDPRGGYFVWLQLPEGVTSRALAEEAKREAGINFGAGHRFAVPSPESVGVEPWQFVRLCFAYYDSERLEEGVMRIAACLERVMAGQMERENGGHASGIPLEAFTL